jgi:hypothetical protein
MRRTLPVRHNDGGCSACLRASHGGNATGGALQFFIPRRKAGAHQFFTLREAELFTKPSNLDFIFYEKLIIIIK